MVSRETSKKAYEILCDEGVDSEQRLKVFRSINSSGRDGITRQEIVEDTNLSINAVCGRVNELMKENRVFEAGDTRYNETTKKQNLIIRSMRYNEAWVTALKRTMGW